MIFGIWKIRPADGSVPFEIESIEALIGFARPLITSVIWRVGIKPGLSVDAVAAAMNERD